LVVGFTIGLAAPPVFVLVFEGPTDRILDEIDVTYTLEGLVPIGLAAGMALGLTDFLSRGDIAQEARSPLRSFRSDRILGLISGLAVWLSG
jgi:hypothetical protein